MKKIFDNKKILYLVLIIVIILVGGSSFIAGYYLAQNRSEQIVKNEKIKAKEALKELQRLVDKNLEKNVKHYSKLKEENHTREVVNSEVIDFNENRVEKNNTIYIVNVLESKKPKLVIIMDDISFNYQVKELKNLNLKITPSFFPPTHIHPNTPIYAKQFKHCMVHFPMQATNPNFKEEENTLHIYSTYRFIESRVKEIKTDFPNVVFVNNHTGSKFTANYKSMDKLFRALNKYNLMFVDSRTTAETCAPKIAKKYNQILFSRDVFLDNVIDVSYIQKQLKEAIKIAKTKGFAIAICHPHFKTFQALAKSKNILKEVELIYIDELYRFYKKNKLSKL